MTIADTATVTNRLGQRVGFALPEWKPPPYPPRDPMSGGWCVLERLDPSRHVRDLYAANGLDTQQSNWTYLPYGPFDSEEAYAAWMSEVTAGNDPQMWAIVDLESGRAVGVAGYLRIAREEGTIEVGHLNYSPLLQRRPAATEAMYLMMRRVFELGYRRYEWKCDALNAPSRASAERLGFSCEGVFRQARVTKGRNRDTAWYSVIDREWPRLQAGFERWLAAENFDDGGRQRRSLRSLQAVGDHS